MSMIRIHRTHILRLGLLSILIAGLANVAAAKADPGFPLQAGNLTLTSSPVVDGAVSKPNGITMEFQNVIYLPLVHKPASLPLVGRWLDPGTTGTVTTIDWVNNGYAVISIINPNRGGNELTWWTWSGSVLRWEYCPPDMYCITSETISTDTLITNWWWTNGGSSGTTTYVRLP